MSLSLMYAIIPIDVYYIETVCYGVMCKVAQTANTEPVPKKKKKKKGKQNWG